MSDVQKKTVSITTLPQTITFASLDLSYSATPQVYIQELANREMYPSSTSKTQVIVDAIGSGIDPPFSIVLIIISDVAPTIISAPAVVLTDDLGTGPPLRGAIINTFPKQLRFEQKFDLAYTIRYDYVVNPPLLTSMTGAFYLPSQFHEGILKKAKELIANDLGNDVKALKFEAAYQRWLQDNRNLAKTDGATQIKTEFSHFA